MFSTRTLTLLVIMGGATAAYLRGFVTLDYDAQTAKEKFDYLVSQIVSDSSPGSWPPLVGFPPASALAYIFIESMKPTVSDSTDIMPDGRYKLIHSVGGAASVSLELEVRVSEELTNVAAANYYAASNISLYRRTPTLGCSSRLTMG